MLGKFYIRFFHPSPQVIVEKAPKARVPDLDKRKYLVPSDLTGNALCLFVWTFWGHIRCCSGVTLDCSQGSFLAKFMGPYGMLVIEIGSVMYKENALLAVPPLQPL